MKNNVYLPTSSRDWYGGGGSCRWSQTGLPGPPGQVASGYTLLTAVDTRSAAGDGQIFWFFRRTLIRRIWVAISLRETSWAMLGFNVCLLVWFYLIPYDPKKTCLPAKSCQLAAGLWFLIWFSSFVSQARMLSGKVTRAHIFSGSVRGLKPGLLVFNLILLLFHHPFPLISFSRLLYFARRASGILNVKLYA